MGDAIRAALRNGRAGSVGGKASRGAVLGVTSRPEKGSTTASPALGEAMAPVLARIDLVRRTGTDAAAAALGFARGASAAEPGRAKAAS